MSVKIDICISGLLKLKCLKCIRKWDNSIYCTVQYSTYSYSCTWHHFILNCPSLKGNHAPNPKFERLIEKTQNPNFSWNRSRIGASSSLESSMKQIFRRFESNQNKSKQMKINDFFIVLHLKPKTLLY